ncbi:iron ABC transporter permease [Aquisalimonas lutea]|uniref:FecCD family ABC transporter permease n=1 Tax=Aquisalimonas lutea TaxID=1327750 RepID=UPI0025B34F3C|nr:iron ABC transporter permease [Aquisalimonas lutea]MDN3518859.1 iron ABC transporter permease [Aquisalimonas lutea]
MTAPRHEGRSARLLAGALVALVLPALVVLSLVTGAGEPGPVGSLRYLLSAGSVPDAATADTVIRTLRLPRTAAAVVVGIALGVAGCLLQALTRNPLAETGILGINAGAALAVVLGITYAGAGTGAAYLVWAFAGALAGSALVLLLANAGAATPLRLVLAGIALGSTFSGLTAAVLLGNQASYDQYRFWVLGTLSGVDTGALWFIMPAVAASVALALLVTRPLSALLLGDDAARALGHHPRVIRAWVALAATLAAGSAVALAGPIAFLGLLAPHAARAVAGPRLGVQCVLSGVVGAAVLLGADIVARVVVPPFEVPASVLVALLGAPVMIWVVRSNRLLRLTTSGGGP